MTPKPRSSASWLVSRTVTGNPALAKQIAMPPPMVPAPITPPLAILGRLPGAGRPGTLRVLRSAKNTWISALASTVALVRLASSVSYSSPSSKGSLAEALTASMAVNAAVRLGYWLLAWLVSRSRMAAVAVAGSTLRSEVRRTPARSRSRPLAKSTAASRTSP